jgi:poly(glycerol-phosphate) alpha-glucosyltransferase
MTHRSVAFLLSNLSHRGGGVVTSASSLARALTGTGLNVSVLGPDKEPSSRWLDLWGGVPAKAIRTIGPRRLGFAPGLMHQVRASHPALVHQHGLWTPTSRVTVKWKRTGGRVLISPHGMLDAWALTRSWRKKKVALWAYEGENLSGADCIHALNVAERDALRQFGLSNPIAIIPNGVDLPHVPEVRHRPPGRRRLLFLGRIHPKKGLVNLLRAWAMLRVQSPALAAAWELRIAGWDDGGHEADLRELVRQLRLADSVRFIGPVFGREHDAEWHAAAGFVLPSLSEGMPMAVLEAWAWRLPVWMTGNCNLPEGFRAGAAIEIQSAPESMAATLVQTLGDSAALEDVGQRGRSLVERDFAWPVIASRFSAVYGWLSFGKPLPSDVDLGSAPEAAVSQR